MAFEYHLVGAETGMSTEDIVAHFRAGLVDSSSPIFSGVGYSNKDSVDELFEFTPVSDSDADKKCYFKRNGSDKGVSVPNRDGTLRRTDAVGTAICLLCYYTWVGGAAYIFTHDQTGYAVNGGVTLFFLKANDGSPVIFLTGGHAGVYNQQDVMFYSIDNVTKTNMHGASIREVSDAFNDVRMPYNDALTQFSLIPFNFNPNLNGVLYTPNAFYMHTGARAPIHQTDSWRLMDINGETYLTNTYFAFREEKGA